MMDHLQQLVGRFLAGEDVSGDELLWGALVVGLLFATVHLITMLVTRWGDHKATTKSLIFSIVVHLSCGLGLLAMNVPAPPSAKKVASHQPDDPFRYVDIRFDGTETFRTELAGNTPLFDKLPRPKDEALTRREKQPLDLQSLPEPKREPLKIAPQEPPEPQLAALPAEKTAAPQPLADASAGPLQQAVIPQRIIDEAAPQRSLPRNPTRKTVRRLPIVRPAQVNESVVRELSKGTTDRVADQTRLDQRVALKENHRSPRSDIRSDTKQPVIRSRISPLPSVEDVPRAGLSARRPTRGSAGHQPSKPKFVRLRSRAPESVPDGRPDRFRPTLRPKTPSPARQKLAALAGPSVRPLRVGPRPTLSRPSHVPRHSRRSRNLPATYRLRSLANRKITAEKFGGTDASERAVERALSWLARNQHPDGYWDADAFGAGQVNVDENGVQRRFAGRDADAGITALALLSFLGAGYTHEEGRYAATVEKALRWLIAQQRSDGYLGGKARHYARMYCHGMATYALAEAYGMQSDPTVDTRLRRPLEKAVRYILDMQNPADGGWRYIKGQISDMSMFGWQMMALKSAEIAGLPIPDSAKRGMIRFLKERSSGKNQGLASYQKHYPVTAAMTAEALFCKQMFRIPRRHPASREAVAYLMQRVPRRSQLNLYYWYYGTLAMFQYGGPEWKTWNDAVRESLIAEQITTGPNAGSWAPRGPWGPYGGRVFSTAMSVLCLEVYYRFLPLYQMSGRDSDQ